MDLSKKIKFNSKMGRPKYSKGGYIKKIAGRKYFDVGGVASNEVAPGALGGNVTNTNTQGIGGITSALGLNAESANITPGTNVAQLNNAYTGANNAINAEVGLANTVNPGVQTGVNAQNQVLNQELAMAGGAGPNPAKAQLAQTTGTNVSNEAAALAGQRGSSANVGLAARTIGQQGATTQEQAAGQAATLEAQQQIAAQNNAVNIAAQQVAQGQGATTALNSAQQNEQGILQNANTSLNNAGVSQQSNINNVNAQQNANVLGGITKAASALPIVGGLFERGGEVGKAGISPHGKHKLDFIHKMTKMGMEHYDSGGSVYNPIQDQTAPIDIHSGENLNLTPIGGKKKEASPVPMGTSSDSTDPNITGQNNSLAASSDVMTGGAADAGPSAALAEDAGILAMAYKGGEMHSHFDNHFENYFKGGESKKVPAMVSPGEVYLPPDAVDRVKHGADPLKEGMRIPGKAKVRGDSLKNDTVPATLEEGGVVIDREHVKHPDKARLFVLKSLRATGKHMKRPGGMS